MSHQDTGETTAANRLTCFATSAKTSLAAGVDTFGRPPASIPNAKGQARTDRSPYRDLYDAESRAIVAGRYAREIDLLGYVF